MILEKKGLDMPSDNNVLVAVYMITYNHADFIEEAIESVMMQQTNFAYKLIIGEDCSTDATRSICLKLHAKYPDRIELLLHDKNVGANQNAKLTFELCQKSNAQYIAILEGDDYWTDPFKLQKQVNVLTQNLDCCICYTAISKLEATTVSYTKKTHTVKTDFTDLVKGNYISTLSVMFRTKEMFPLPYWFTQLVIGDWPLYLWLLRKGEKAYYLDEITAMYRTNVGISLGIKNDSEKEIRILDDILKTFVNDSNFKAYKNCIKDELKSNKIKYINVFNRQKRYGKALVEFLKIMVTSPNLKIIKLYFYSLKMSLS